MKLLVVGSLTKVPSHPELCAPFVAKLGELIDELTDSPLASVSGFTSFDDG